MSPEERNLKVRAALNRLTKWRSIFAGWQLGTRAAGDPECEAVRDHRELTILLRCELNALTGALIETGLLDKARFQELLIHLIQEARLLERDYELKFPGCRAMDFGMTITERAKETMKGWKP